MFFFSVLANNRAGSQPDSARSLGRWSIAVSIINIIIGLIIFIVVIVWYVLAVASVYSEILEGFERNQTQLSVSIIIIQVGDIKQ
jgi:hypothetical protein